MEEKLSVKYSGWNNYIHDISKCILNTKTAPDRELIEKWAEEQLSCLDKERWSRYFNFEVGICRRTPWESKCMVQALTAKKLLNGYKLPCTLYMGVGKDQAGEMIAHAWLRCGNFFVTGGRRHLHYAVTGIFGDKE